MKKVSVVSLLIIIYSCGQKENHSSASTVDLNAIKEIIKGKNELYRAAYLKGDSAAFANLHHNETINMPPGGTILRGKAAIGETVTKVPREGVRDMIINTTDVYGGPDYVIEEGTFGLVTQKDLYKGKYIVIWKPESGIWKIY